MYVIIKDLYLLAWLECKWLSADEDYLNMHESFESNYEYTLLNCADI